MVLLGLIVLRRLKRFTQIEVLNSFVVILENSTNILDPILLSFGHFIEAYETFVHRVFTLSHLIGIDFILFLWVAQLLITACLFKVRRLANHQLTQFVNKTTLVARQKTQYCSRLDTLPMNELSQVKLFIQVRL